MKKIDLGQTLQLLGNAGVIVGILLLVYELNQNRQMMQAQTRNAISETIVDRLLGEADNPDLAAINLKAEAGETMTALETRRYQLIWQATFRYWENVNYQYRNGLYDDSEYLAHREAWRQIAVGPHVRDLWCERRSRYADEFVAEMDELLGENLCD